MCSRPPHGRREGIVQCRASLVRLLVDEFAAYPMPGRQVADRLRLCQGLNGQVLAVTLGQPRRCANASIHTCPAAESARVRLSAAAASTRLHVSLGSEPRQILWFIRVFPQPAKAPLGDPGRQLLEQCCPMLQTARVAHRLSPRREAERPTRVAGHIEVPGSTDRLHPHDCHAAGLVRLGSPLLRPPFW